MVLPGAGQPEDSKESAYLRQPMGEHNGTVVLPGDPIRAGEAERGGAAGRGVREGAGCRDAGDPRGSGVPPAEPPPPTYLRRSAPPRR